MLTGKAKCKKVICIFIKELMDLDRNTGLYKIENKVNGKVYIGATMNNFHVRWKNHRCELNGNRHQNKELQSDWDKFGEESFEFSIIAICSDIDELSKLERDEIRKYRKLGEVYNKASGGLGVIYDKESAAKSKSIAQSKRYEQWTDEDRKEWGEKMRKYATGYKWQDEDRLKMKDNRNGAKYTVEFIHKLRDMYENQKKSITEIANIVGIPRGTVYGIVTYRRWANF